ncbi:MAG TPA: HemK/PrmC family methyltransferase [Actinomycetota bacterium]|nr:HemK/PrmC family methyltransferase [Actinomycetota bacterium]
MKASELLRRATDRLKASPAIDHWQRDREALEAEDLLAHALGVDEVERTMEVPERVRRRFEAMVDRRARGEPVQLIKGFAEFRGLRLIAKPGVFVPRDSTEFLAEQAIRRLRGRKSPVAVDLATGGGTVALAIANETRRVRVFGTDVAADAVRVARRNAERLRLRATFVRGDLFAGLPARLRHRVDVITLHPPYVARHELNELPDEIRKFEPVHTLTDQSEDGLGLVERAAAESRDWLRPGGWLLIEVSPDRARSVARVLRAHGFRDVRSTKGGDLKITRVVVGRR